MFLKKFMISVLTFLETSEIFMQKKYKELNFCLQIPTLTSTITIAFNYSYCTEVISEGSDSQALTFVP